jgi:transposase-like protein
MAYNKEEANKAFDLFVDKYQTKYPKATACLEKDRQDLLSFYAFSSEHWKHIRTTNPIESTFATVNDPRCLPCEIVYIRVFKLITDAEKNWCRLDEKSIAKTYHRCHIPR